MATSPVSSGSKVLLKKLSRPSTLRLRLCITPPRAPAVIVMLSDMLTIAPASACKLSPGAKVTMPKA